MYRCCECVNYNKDLHRQCTAYNNECNPNEDAENCCEFYKNEEVNFDKLRIMRNKKKQIDH